MKWEFKDNQFEFDFTDEAHALCNEIAGMLDRLHSQEIDRIAIANGYVKAEDYESLKSKLDEATDTLDQIEAESVKFDAEEADYLLNGVEKMKCDDCKGHCGLSGRGMCLYQTLRTKLEAIKEVRGEVIVKRQTAGMMREPMSLNAAIATVYPHLARRLEVK